MAGIRSDGQRQFWSNAAPLRHRDFSTLMTQNGPDAPAQSVGRVARLSGNVRQPNHVLPKEIAGHKAERQPRAGEEWLAATKYDGVEVKSILIDSRSQSYSIRATPFPGFGNRTNTSGSCPGMINRGLVASCFIRSCAARFDLASSVAVIGTCLSRFSYR